LRSAGRPWDGAELLEVERPHALLGRGAAPSRDEGRGAYRLAVPGERVHHGPGGAQGGLPPDGADPERRVFRHLAAHAEARDPGPQPVRERAPEPDATPDPVELARDLRQAPGAEELSDRNWD